MIKYTIERLFFAFCVLFITVSITFMTYRLMPGSFVDDPTLERDMVELLESKYHLNEPIMVQYGYFLKDLTKLDFGPSYKLRPGMPVNDVILEKIPNTLRINIYSSLLTLPLALFFGILAAIKKNTATDAVISTGVVLFISVPSFVLASLLQYFLAYKLKWFPILVSTQDGISWSKFVSLVLPTLALTFGPVASITRYLRAELSEALNSDYMLLAKAKGLTQNQATIRHALRNSIVPLMGSFLGLFIGILGGSMVIEKIFSIPGLGSLSIEAINGKDYAVSVGTMFWFSLLGLIANIVVDLSYGIVDPRIRMGGRK